MVNLTDWSREKKGWWMGMGMGEEEGRMKGKGGKGVVKYGGNGSD